MRLGLIGAKITYVIPAKAGIHLQARQHPAEEKMDAGLRRHDTVERGPSILSLNRLNIAL
jgi:hypothetical protein